MQRGEAVRAVLVGCAAYPFRLMCLHVRVECEDWLLAEMHAHYHACLSTLPATDNMPQCSLAIITQHHNVCDKNIASCGSHCTLQTGSIKVAKSTPLKHSSTSMLYALACVSI